jgi:hypothetical protein
MLASTAFINKFDFLNYNQCLSQDGWFQWDLVPMGEVITTILILLFAVVIGLYL